MDEQDKEIFERLTKCEQSLKSEHKRLDHIETLANSVQILAVEMKQVHENTERLTASVEKMQTTIGETQHIKEDIETLTEKINIIEAKPAKKWEAVVAAIISAIAGGVGTYIITQVIGG